MPNRNEAALFFKSSKPESQQSLRAGVREEAAQRGAQEAPPSGGGGGS